MDIRDEFFEELLIKMKKKWQLTTLENEKIGKYIRNIIIPYFVFPAQNDSSN